MARRAQRTQCHLSDDDHEEVAESDNFSGDEISEEANESSMQTTADGMLQSLDDEALFGVVKKLVCTYVRKIISDVVGFGGSNQGASYGAAAKHVTRQSLSLFSDVIESLTQPKRDVIKSYGFGSLLLFEKCCVPISFAKWVVDHVHLSTQRIILGGMSISITPQTVHDVLGIPIGGKTISKVDPKSGKLGFLKVMQLTTLPSAKDCAENLSKENISDDDLVRNFLIVALVTFLCPNSQSYPNNEYLEPLVHMKKAEGWDWCKFVHYWLFKQIKQYHARRKTPDRISINMGGCLYILCVTYLDHLKTGQQHLPPALPRILVWKGNMIKEKCKADLVKGHTYGKLSFLPTKSTCYHKRSGSKTPPSPTDVIDGLSFKKMLHSTVNENLSPKTLDDMTSLYMKHAAAPTDSAAVNAQSIICDVIGYFYHRAQEAHKSSSSQHEGNANINRDVNTEVHEKRPPTHVDVPVDMNKDTPYVFGSVRANHTNMNDAASGDTLVVPASGEDCSPTPDSIAETMKATESSSQQVYLSQGGRSQSKRRLSTSSISANNENVGCSIAGRTRSRQSSLSPSTSPNIAHQADFVDNPEAILRKRAKRLATRSPQQQETSSQVIATSDTCFDTITGHLSSFNASQAHLSKSPLLLEAGAKTVDVKQNVQKICNQKLKERYKRQKTAHGEVNVQVHLTHGVQLVEESSACNASADDAPPTVGYQECIVAAQRTWGDAQVQQGSRYDTSADGSLKKASQLLSDVLHNADASPRGAHVMSVASKAHAQNSASLSNHMLDPQVTNPKSTHLDPPSVNRVAKPCTAANLLDFSPPSFRLLEEDDDDHNFTPSHIAYFNDPGSTLHHAMVHHVMVLFLTRCQIFSSAPKFL